MLLDVDIWCIYNFSLLVIILVELMPKKLIKLLTQHTTSPFTELGLNKMLTQNTLQVNLEYIVYIQTTN